MAEDYKGISFPFRIGGRGGIAMSGRNITEQQHIKESVMHLLGTNEFERVMNPFKGLEDLSMLFDFPDEAVKNMAIYKITEFLTLNEPRIEVKEITINTADIGIKETAHVIKVLYAEVATNIISTVEQTIQ